MERIPQLYVESSYEDCFDKEGKAKADCIIIQENIEVRLKKGEKIPEFIDKEKAKILKKRCMIDFTFMLINTTTKCSAMP